MKIFIFIFTLVATTLSFDLVKEKRSILGKCVMDTDCKKNEYCDHKFPNPIGECKIGHKNGDTCAFDRHCSSKNCHFLKCVGRKPVKNGPCEKNNHSECIPEQYCSKDKCKDRKCSGWCAHSFECLSGKCDFLRCQRMSTCKN
jgi:hypothetical protein